MQYAYVVYDYDKKYHELIKKYFADGKYHYLEEKTINCLTCKRISKYKEDEYLEAAAKLLEKENKIDIKYLLNRKIEDGK